MPPGRRWVKSVEFWWISAFRRPSLTLIFFYPRKLPIYSDVARLICIRPRLELFICGPVPLNIREPLF